MIAGAGVRERARGETEDRPARGSPAAAAAPPAGAEGVPPPGLLPGERSDLQLLKDLLRRPRVWALAVAYFVAVDLIVTAGIYFRLEARGDPVPFLRIFFGGAAEWLTLEGSRLAAITAGWLFPLARRHWAVRLGAVGAMLAATLVARQYLLNAVLFLAVGVPWDPFAGQNAYLPGHMLSLMLYAGAGAAMRSLLRERERRLAVARLEERVAQARFRALKAQLRPRFLFDTLAAVGRRVHADVPAAEQLLVRTGELLRLTFRHADAERVPLQQELSFAMLYLEIEGVRAGRPVRFRATADRAAREAAVPHMSVFPLVESAVLSAGDGDAPATVEVEARRDRGRLRLEVRDDGGVPLAARRAGPGWAPVEALRARLDELPGARWSLDFADLPGGGVRASLDVSLAPGDA